MFLQAGAADDVTRPELCAARIDGIVAVDPDARIELVLYENVRHAFDHPALVQVGWIPVNGMLPGGCLIVEQPDETFLDATTQQPMTAETRRDVIHACGRKGAAASGDSSAAAASDRAIQFLLAVM